MIVSVSFVDAQIGDEYHIYVCCEEYDDPDSGLKVTFTKDNASEWTVTIPGGGVNGTKTQIPDPSGMPGGGVRGYVCADHRTDGSGMVRAGMISAGYEYAWADDVDPGLGYYCGFGHNNTGHQNKFDDFAFEELRTPEEVCTRCWCTCLRHPPKRALMGTIVNAVDRAACLDGLEWDMDWGWNAGLSNWKGTAEYPRYDTGVQEVDFVLTCDAEDDDNFDHPGKNFSLYWETGSGCCVANTGGCAGVHEALYYSTCKPLSLVFGPFTFRYDDLLCYACYPPAAMDPGGSATSGTYYIVITER
jgi:hypothetical protein